jgi:hypothetical protein
VRPEYQPFVDALWLAMKTGDLSASAVARRVWGTTKDKRGYDVARNRDRIGSYLSGASYPEPENLRRLADAVGVPVEELALKGPRPARASSSYGPGPHHLGSFHMGSRASRSIPMESDLHLASVPGQPEKYRIRLDQILDKDLCRQILDLIEKGEARERVPDKVRLGEVVGNAAL